MVSGGITGVVGKCAELGRHCSPAFAVVRRQVSSHHQPMDASHAIALDRVPQQHSSLSRAPITNGTGILAGRAVQLRFVATFSSWRQSIHRSWARRAAMFSNTDSLWSEYSGGLYCPSKPCITGTVGVMTTGQKIWNFVCVLTGREPRNLIARPAIALRAHSSQVT